MRIRLLCQNHSSCPLPVDRQQVARFVLFSIATNCKRFSEVRPAGYVSAIGKHHAKGIDPEASGTESAADKYGTLGIPSFELAPDESDAMDTDTSAAARGAVDASGETSFR